MYNSTCVNFLLLSFSQAIVAHNGVTTATDKSQSQATNTSPPPQPGSSSIAAGVPPQPESTAVAAAGVPPQPESTAVVAGVPPQPESTAVAAGIPPQPESSDAAVGVSPQSGPSGTASPPQHTPDLLELSSNISSVSPLPSPVGAFRRSVSVSPPESKARLSIYDA